MKYAYFPLPDELKLEIFLPKKTEEIHVNNFRIIFDKESKKLSEIIIDNYISETKEFKSKLNTVQLNGIWKNFNITELDIKSGRKELLKHLNGKF